MVDNIIQGKDRTFREFGSYYTDSDPILTYMVKKLDIKDDDHILEPCAGEGVFIKKILELEPNTKVLIDGVDLNQKAVDSLISNFDNNLNISIRKADTLLDLKFDEISNNPIYTKVIGNPPYGAWQDQEKRIHLKKKYGGYVKETYTLFITRSLDLLKKTGKLVFIIPDTFLAINLHKELRRKILTETQIEEIVLMPSNFFPGVNFGYSNLCIITLKKNTPDDNHRIRTVYLKDSVSDLFKIANKDYSVSDKVEDFYQSEVLNSLNHSFLLGGDQGVRNLINSTEVRFKDVADCVTGFYSGDNKKFIRFGVNSYKIPEGYQTVTDNLIEFNYKNHSDLITGLKNGKKFIPFLKGGKGKFKKNTDCFIEWDTETINFYKKNKASRFQNSQFYFKEGIGVPMVKSSKINAFLLEGRLFDQSIVGIFPKDPELTFYLLAFLNSDVCSEILKTINHTANNSANYMRSLPIIVDKKYLKKIEFLVKKGLSGEDDIEVESEINSIFSKIYSSKLLFK